MVRKFIVVLLASLGALVFATTMIAVAGGPSQLKPQQFNPWKGKSDAEKQAAIAGFHQREVDYVNGFAASGVDPRTLPQAEEEVFGGNPYVNPDGAIAGADAIFTGHVESVKFSHDVKNADPVTEVTLTVNETLKGDARRMIVLREAGGPVPAADGGGFLVHLPGTPILLPGDDVLILAKVTPKAAAPLYQVGIYYIRNGLVFAPEGNPCASVFNGTPVAQALEFVRTSVAKIGLGPISPTPSCGMSSTPSAGAAAP